VSFHTQQDCEFSRCASATLVSSSIAFSGLAFSKPHLFRQITKVASFTEACPLLQRGLTSFRLGQIRNGVLALIDSSRTLIVAVHALLHTVAAIVAVERESLLRILGEVTFPRSRACGIRVEFGW
jgi:hypothetical protein